ncbi:hypothetical protein JCM19239_5313 [Vibrio variabilis]|uniref:Uncharacterized protein n=1 Tax=Vibrio variabilis TaxID=990271 RepID=A0ABQ0JCI5_9VIBR|nr:hypothetical protein JCM19239_5313 [Vibrio variabilis]
MASSAEDVLINIIVATSNSGSFPLTKLFIEQTVFYRLPSLK